MFSCDGETDFALVGKCACGWFDRLRSNSTLQCLVPLMNIQDIVAKSWYLITSTVHLHQTFPPGGCRGWGKHL